MTAEFELDRDTRVVREGDAFVAEISGGWSIGTAPNGGYLAAILVRAMAEVSPLPDPFSTTVHYVRTATPGPASVTVESIRVGHRHSTFAARLVQGGIEVARAISTFGALDSLEGPTVVPLAAPDLQTPDACVSGRPGPTSVLPIAQRVDMRIPRGEASWTEGAKSGRSELCGWVRFADHRPVDPLALLFFADAFPPPVLNLDEAAASWVPTLELTVHLRRRPSPGWIRGRFRTRALIGGYLDEDGELWDDRGELVAMSRQLARLQRA